MQKGDEVERPPLGLIPHWLWVEQRANEIIAAMQRYAYEQKVIPKEWIGELKAHFDGIREKNPIEIIYEAKVYRHWRSLTDKEVEDIHLLTFGGGKAQNLMRGDVFGWFQGSCSPCMCAKQCVDAVDYLRSIDMEIPFVKE